MKLTADFDCHLSGWSHIGLAFDVTAHVRPVDTDLGPWFRIQLYFVWVYLTLNFELVSMRESPLCEHGVNVVDEACMECMGLESDDPDDEMRSAHPTSDKP